MTENDDTLSALRDWSRPGRRAELVAAAWLANHSVVAIAEAARVTRPTVYSDLRSQGIDPETTKRTEGETMLTLDISIMNMTGIDADDSQLVDGLYAKARELDPDSPEMDTARNEIILALQVSLLLSQYREIAPTLDPEADARAALDRAMHVEQTRWEALATAESWLAAHHAWIVADDNAHKAIDAWQAAARKADGMQGRTGADLGQMGKFGEQLNVIGQWGLDVPEQIKAAYRPELCRSAVDQEAARMRSELKKQHQERAALTARTFNAGGHQV
jgi:hypothetical protein